MTLLLLLLMTVAASAANIVSGSGPITLGGNVSFAPIPDTTAPIVESITLASDGTNLTIVHSEAMTCGAGGNGGWTIYPPGLNATFILVSTNGANVTGYSSRQMYSNEVMYMTYAQPGNGWEDLSGNDLASTNAFLVTNNSTYGTTYLFAEDFEHPTSTNWIHTNPANITENSTSGNLYGNGSMAVTNLTGTYKWAHTNFAAPSEVYGYCTARFYVVGMKAYPVSLSTTNVANYMAFWVDNAGQIVAAKSLDEETHVEYYANLQADTQYHFWWHYVRSTGNNGILQVWYTNSSTKPNLPIIDISDATTVGEPQQIVIQAYNAAFHVDKIRLSANPIMSNPD